MCSSQSVINFAHKVIAHHYSLFTINYSLIIGVARSIARCAAAAHLL
jgi:hypothetical protein